MKGVGKKCRHYWFSEAATKRKKVMHRENKEKNNGSELDYQSDPIDCDFKTEKTPTSLGDNSEPDVEAVEDNVCIQ